MHDIGSSQLGNGWGRETAGEFGNEFEGEFGFSNEFAGQFEGEFSFEGEGGLSEMQELELAAELLAVSNEQELENFLGKLLGGAAKAAGAFMRSDAGKALGGILRNAAKTALPIAGTALGNLVAPGVGGVIGGKLASMAGQAFGLELEGLSNEDREFEVARRFVRLSNTAAQRLVQAPAQMPPEVAARTAFLQAARQVAPGIVGNLRTPVAPTAAAASYAGAPAVNGGPRSCQVCGAMRSGRWVRRGNTIVLFPSSRG